MIKISHDINFFINQLESIYGKAEYYPRFEPLDTLVCCILSQNTSDINSHRAFDKLKETFSTWELVVDAGAEELAKVIFNAGLSNQKSKYILKCLAAIKEKVGTYDINFLENMPMLEARNWLENLPGVGPKTASIVLCFSFAMDAIPLDTHVYRVSQRLGILPKKMNVNKAHDYLLDVVLSGFAYRYHMAFIRHGRQICKAQKPKCMECIVQSKCNWFQENKNFPEKYASLKKVKSFYFGI